VTHFLNAILFTFGFFAKVLSAFDKGVRGGFGFVSHRYFEGTFLFLFSKNALRRFFSFYFFFIQFSLNTKLTVNMCS
jgi:hypothetical protein